MINRIIAPVCCPCCRNVVVFEFLHGVHVWVETQEPEALCYDCGHVFIWEQRISLADAFDKADYLSTEERERIHQLCERGHEIPDDDDSYEPEPLI